MRLSHFLAAIEPLESRIAPAVLFDPQTVTYTDSDGDAVTVHVSKGDLTNRLTFDTAFTDSGPQTLFLINLKSRMFKHADLTVTSVQGGSGDGFADLGFVNAKKIDLGDVNIDGDLAKIVAGDKKTGTPGLGDLTLQSLAAIGPSTGAPNPYSSIKGAVGNLTINGDVLGQFFVGGGSKGSIASVTVGGSLIGVASNDFTGNIFCQGNMGPAHISGSMSGAANARESGVIIVDGNLTSLQIDGSINGSSGDFSGNIFVKKHAGPITIGIDVNGSSGQGSGLIDLHSAEDININGSLLGGSGVDSGEIFVRKDAGDIHIFSTLTGGDGLASGSIRVRGDVNSLKVDLNVTGSTGEESALIFVDGTINEVVLGSLAGSSGAHSGTIRADGDLPLFTINGAVSSGSGLGSGSIVSSHNIGTLSITGSVTGTAANPVFIAALGQFAPHGASNVSITSATINGSAQFLNIEAGYDPFFKGKNADAQIGTVHIVGTVMGTNIVAGSKAGADGVFGTTDDAKIKGGVGSVLSKIQQVTFDTVALATADTSDHFGIVAEEVQAVSVNASALTLTSGPHNDHGVQVGTALDFSVEEV